MVATGRCASNRQQQAGVPVATATGSSMKVRNIARISSREGAAYLGPKIPPTKIEKTVDFVYFFGRTKLFRTT